jgi:transposase
MSSESSVVVRAEVPGSKRRKRSAAERLRIVEETLAPGVSVAAVARAHGINANQIFAWRKLHLDGKLAGRKPEAAKPATVEASVERHSITRLLPVSVSDTPLIAAASSAPVASAMGDAEPSTPQPAISSIHIQFAKAKVHVEGAADPQLLRAVLECLRG